MFSYSLVFKAGLIILGVWWCKEVLGRWRSDVAELKECNDRIRQGVIVFIWLLTVVIIVLITRFGWSALDGIVREFR